jgi:hypothetical protein
MPSLVQVNLIPNGDALYGTGIAFTILAGVAVVLRLMSKVTNHAPYGADDWFISIGFALWLIEQGCGLAALDAGKAATSLTDPRFKNFRKVSPDSRNNSTSRSGSDLCNGSGRILGRSSTFPPEHWFALVSYSFTDGSSRLQLSIGSHWSYWYFAFSSVSQRA